MTSVLPFSNLLVDVEFGLPDILLPLGISFYTFQILALTIDTYRGEIEPIESLREYALFVCFFPQLIAGPILRGQQLLPQIRNGGRPSPERTRRGLWLLTSGILKKVLIADVLLAPYVDRVYAAPGFATSPEHLLAVYSFAFQIYFDFSGYTDMARGIALLLGFEIPPNFLRALPVDGTRRSSGAAGTSPSRSGCATTSTSPWAAIAAALPVRK